MEETHLTWDMIAAGDFNEVYDRITTAIEKIDSRIKTKKPRKIQPKPKKTQSKTVEQLLEFTPEQLLKYYKTEVPEIYRILSKYPNIKERLANVLNKS